MTSCRSDVNTCFVVEAKVKTGQEGGQVLSEVYWLGITVLTLCLIEVVTGTSQVLALATNDLHSALKP